MQRFQKILAHPLFLEELGQIKEKEQSRIFCKHSIEHLLDVCRIMQIYVSEQHLPFSIDLVYACGLLHDIGRNFEDHHIASAKLAEQILPQCDYTAKEIAQITKAILSHRNNESEDSLAQLLYRADKESRLCFLCDAKNLCNWPKEKQNTTVRC